MASLRVAIFQCAAGGQSLNERLAGLSCAIVGQQSSAETKIDLLVCPELFASGYNIGDELVEKADAERGATFKAFATVAREHNVALCYGYPQRVGDKLYNTAAFIGADGQLLANHQKQLNSPGSFEENYFTTGNKTTSLTYCGVNISIVICYEIEFPESIRNAAVDGVHLVLVPTALVSQWEIVATCVVPTRAFENGVWIAYANHAGRENGFEYLGGSKIVAPDGVVTVDAGNEASLISTVIDLDQLKAAQARLPYLRDFGKLKA